MIAACDSQKLDEYGGFYNEKTGRYKYVRPIKRASRHSTLGVSQPSEKKPQQIWGLVSGFSEDLKSFWVYIDDRQSYQMLAEHVTGLNRDDKNKRLRIHLKYVSPLGSIPDPALRRQWQPYVTQQLEALFGQDEVYVTTFYHEKTKQFSGEAFKIIQTKDGEIMRNLNLRMVYEGLSVYFFDPKEKEPQKDYIKAQALAKERRAGLWNYQ